MTHSLFTAEWTERDRGGQMKFSLVAPAGMAALALAGVGLVAPAQASTDRGGEPEVVIRHDKETLKFEKNELCRFAVALKLDVHVKTVITNGGDDVTETARGWVKATNRKTHDSLRLPIKEKSIIKVARTGETEPGRLKGETRGKALRIGGDIKVHSPKQGHVSAANQGHQKNKGMYYIHGKFNFRVTNLGPDLMPKARIDVKKGHVLDVCEALAPHGH